MLERENVQEFMVELMQQERHPSEQMLARAFFLTGGLSSTSCKALAKDTRRLVNYINAKLRSVVTGKKMTAGVRHIVLALKPTAAAHTKAVPKEPTASSSSATASTSTILTDVDEAMETRIAKMYGVVATPRGSQTTVDRKVGDFFASQDSVMTICSSRPEADGRSVQEEEVEEVDEVPGTQEYPEHVADKKDSQQIQHWDHVKQCLVRVSPTGEIVESISSLGPNGLVVATFGNGPGSETVETEIPNVLLGRRKPEPDTSVRKRPAARMQAKQDTEEVDEAIDEHTDEPIGEPVGEVTGEVVGEPVGEPTGKPFGEPVGKPTGKPVGEVTPPGVPSPVCAEVVQHTTLPDGTRLRYQPAIDQAYIQKFDETSGKYTLQCGVAKKRAKNQHKVTIQNNNFLSGVGV